MKAIWIVLDPEDRLGHHGFVDSDNFGPRSTALVEEFIPWLERRFRLVSSPKARFLTGHSSGGWSSLWLQLNHPEFFGGCFSSAPDPVDVTAFETVDLTSDQTLFTDAWCRAGAYTQFLAVDERMIKYRGHYDIRKQRLPSKPIKNGLKAFVLAGATPSPSPSPSPSP